MALRDHAHVGTIPATLNYWPSYVDVLMTVLMVFLLQSFLQTTLNVDNLEAARLRQAQMNLKQSLEKEFSRESAEGEIGFDISPNLLQVRFSEKILFPSGQYKLAPTGTAILKRCSQVLARPGVATYEQIQVEGHTDSSPLARSAYPQDNWELSTARALTVVKRMISDGIEPAKLSANGYAEFRPIATDPLTSQRGLNRRIELRIIFSTPKRARRGNK